MEKQYPHKVKECYRLTRVKPPGEDAAIPGVNSVGDRHIAQVGIIAQFDQMIKAQSSVVVEGRNLSIPRKTYVAQCKLHWGDTDEEALATWRMKIIAKGLNPDAEESASVNVPFSPPVAQVGTFGRVNERTLSAPTKEIHDSKDMMNVLELMQGATQKMEIGNNFKDLGGDALAKVFENAPGVASSSNQLSIDNIRPGSLPSGPPVIEGVIPEKEEEPEEKRSVTVPRYWFYSLSLLNKAVHACTHT